VSVTDVWISTGVLTVEGFRKTGKMYKPLIGYTNIHIYTEAKMKLVANVW